MRGKAGDRALQKTWNLLHDRGVIMSEKKPRMIRISVFQHGPNTEDILQNRERILRRVDKIAEKEKPDFLLLGELTVLPYIGAVLDTKYFEWAEPIPGPTTELFGEMAKKHGMCLMVGVFEKAGYEGVYYNSLVLLGPDGKIIEGIFPDGKKTLRYVKTHIPYVVRDPSKYNEAFYFTPGFGWPIFNTPKARIGLTICFDRHFPEPFRILALQGAEIIFNPNVAMGFTATAGGASMADTFLTELQSRAVENCVWVCVANKAGTEILQGQETFCYGQSAIIDPTGKIVAKALADEETVVTYEADLEDVVTARRTLPFFRARRPHLYTLITRED
jgi:beta-ureidopropionase